MFVLLVPDTESLTGHSLCQSWTFVLLTVLFIISKLFHLIGLSVNIFIVVVLGLCIRAMTTN